MFWSICLACIWNGVALRTYVSSKWQTHFSFFVLHSTYYCKISTSYFVISGDDNSSTVPFSCTCRKKKLTTTSFEKKTDVSTLCTQLAPRFELQVVHSNHWTVCTVLITECRPVNLYLLFLLWKHGSNLQPGENRVQNIGSGMKVFVI